MIKERRSVPIDVLRKLVSYNPETGIFIWNERDKSFFNPTKKRSQEHSMRQFNSMFAGRVAGGINQEGYHILTVCGVTLLGHRAAYAFTTGSWPDDEIDHQNGIKSDNRWANIRPASRSENAMNLARRRDNLSGVVGIDWHSRSRKWRARITVGKSTTILGSFTSFAEAQAVRLQAERTLGFHKNHGRIAA